MIDGQVKSALSKVDTPTLSMAYQVRPKTAFVHTYWSTVIHTSNRESGRDTHTYRERTDTHLHTHMYTYR